MVPSFKVDAVLVCGWKLYVLFQYWTENNIKSFSIGCVIECSSDHTWGKPSFSACGQDVDPAFLQIWFTQNIKLSEIGIKTQTLQEREENESWYIVMSFLSMS